MYAQQTVAVFYKHRVSLQRVFAYYAHLKKPVLTSANAPKTMCVTASNCCFAATLY